MNNKFLKIVMASGVPWFFISFILLFIIYKEGYIKTMDSVWSLSFLFWLFIFCKNAMWFGQDKEYGLFTWTEKYKPEPLKHSTKKYRAQHPNIDRTYLDKEPDGLVLGKQNDKYVRVKIEKNNILNAILMGAPGSGKSVLLLTMLLYQLNFKKENPSTFFVLDIKPELCKKSTFIKGNPKVHMMNPLDRCSYGWNPYYNLSPDASDDKICAELDVIARALVDAGKGERNEFFYESARNIMKAVLLYTFRQGKSFMQGLEYLLNNNISSVIQVTLDDIEDRHEYYMVKTLLQPYSNKDNSEAFQGIELAFRQSLSIFTLQTTKFYLDGNPRKASPLDLEEKISVFFSLPENKIDEYKCLLRLVTMQVVHHCSSRPEDAHILTLIIDEAARLGAINWISFLSTSRSRQCATILAFQSLSQMQTVWSKEEAKSLIELCRIIAVLSCSDSDTANMLSSWAGEYCEDKHSYNMDAKHSGSYSRSFESKKILEPVDIMTLQESGEVLLFIKGKYMRVKVNGARYFNIKKLNNQSQMCLTTNNQQGDK